MKWLEVIMVRSAGSTAKILTKPLQDLMADVARGAGSDDIRIFHRENLETDICIVLFHSGKKTHTGGSTLGLHIVTAFKEVGLVHHTIWNEVKR
jgi:hypothetical protein